MAYITIDQNTITNDPNVTVIDTQLLRAYFAGQALNMDKNIWPFRGFPDTAEDVAICAFKIADAMIKKLYE